MILNWLSHDQTWFLFSSHLVLLLSSPVSFQVKGPSWVSRNHSSDELESRLAWPRRRSPHFFWVSLCLRHQRGGFFPKRMGLCVFLPFVSPIRLFSSSKQQSPRRPPPRIPLRTSSTTFDVTIDRPSGLDCARGRYVALGCLGATTALVLLAVFVCVFPD
jgi:hypothetical protein